MTGKYIPQTRVTAALKRVETKSRDNIRGLSEGLQQGTIALPDWRAGMLREIKQVHLVNAAVAKGGWAQMTPTDFGRVGGKVGRQYKYLNNFAAEIQSGKQSVNGIPFRADLYGKAGHTTYEATQQQTAQDAGKSEEKNVLGQADHCQDCLDETGKGFVPIGTLIPIGERICTIACRCHLVYRGDNKEGNVSHGIETHGKSFEDMSDSDITEFIKTVTPPDAGAVGLRGIYKEEIGKTKLRDSYVWTDGDRTSQKLDGTSVALMDGDYSNNPEYIMQENISRYAQNAKDYGDSGFIAVVYGDLNTGEITEDPGEGILMNARVAGYIKKRKG